MFLCAVLRLLALTLATIPLYLGWVLTRPLAWVVPSLERPLQRIWIGSWAKASLWIMGVRATYEGPAPEGSYFLVANHLSYIDIPLLLARLDARFLAKAEIAGWPVMGFLARTTGTLFIDRTRKRDLTRVFPLIRHVLDRGTGVIVFPEGTSTDGSQVERFKPSLFEVPVEMGLEVHCSALHYHSPKGPLPAWQAVCWWGDATFAPHFWQFLKQPRTDAVVTFSSKTVGDTRGTGADGPAAIKGDRKVWARQAQDAVERVFTPSRVMRQEEASADPLPDGPTGLPRLGEATAPVTPHDTSP